MEQSKYYTYHEEKIQIPETPHIKKLLKIFEKRNYKPETITYFLGLYINSYCKLNNYQGSRTLEKNIKLFFNDSEESISFQEMFMKIKVKSKEYELPSDFIIETIKNFDYNKSNTWCRVSHFEWNEKELANDFGNKENVDKQKCILRNKMLRYKNRLKKTELLLELIKYNPHMTRTEIFEYFEKKKGNKNEYLSRPTIYRIIKEENLQFKKESKSFTLIRKSLNRIFTTRIDNSKINKIITYELISSELKINKRTVLRFFKENTYYCNRLKEHNSIIKDLNNELKR